MTSNTFIYYIYAYLREDGTPYYIGKGKGDRAWKQHRIDNKGIHTPSSDRIVILESNLSNVGSLALERRLIKWYGRKDLGTGILRNKTDGGDGTNGPKSQSHKNAISNANKGKTRPKMSIAKRGVSIKPHSEIHKLNLSVATKGIPKPKPKLVCRISDKKEMALCHFIRWCK